MGNSLDDLLTGTNRGTANPVGSGFRSVMSTRSRPCRRALIAVPSAPYTESVGLLSTVLQLSSAVVVPSSLTLSHTLRYSVLSSSPSLVLFSFFPSSSSSSSSSFFFTPAFPLLSIYGSRLSLPFNCVDTPFLFLSLSLSLSLSRCVYSSRLFSSIDFSVLYYIHYVDQYAA